ncbi:sensor histidine kinase [Nocardia blacklockiae]|uniref:sensor histidine kinase n=1 Tax=Nocardia blacklockiae TaxID=480036 RepID=UPI001895C59B|nr:histidine kinase [Nocardia blacklockiae]MBF6173657.1 histidine kinase [Nocardia blacklockiae]
MAVTDATGQGRSAPAQGETGPTGTVAGSRLPARIGARLREFLHDPVNSVRRKIENTSYDYPPSVIYTADGAMIITAIAAAALRHDYFATTLPFVAVLILVLCYPIIFLFDLEPHPIVLAGSAMAAAAIFLAQPVSPDCSTLVLTVVVGEVAAIAPKKVSIAVTVAALLELLLFAALGNVEAGLPMYLVGVVLGWMVGLMLQFQRRFLYQERENQENRAIRAADEERRRIAREVHDVIAHSLSVTMLHLTAARHALQTDRDVDEAVDALTDAERLGRQAMSDIRRTVGLLDQRPSSWAPEPGLDDMDGLVADFVRAGLPVDYTLVGDTGSVSAATGLALYRISQESLANVAKHAPGAEVVLRIEITASEVSALVTNTTPGWTVHRGRGMGISGMRQRATLLGGSLTAGPGESGWQVRARIPLGGEKSAGGCAAGAVEDPLRLVRDAFASMTRKMQEGT